MNEKEFYLRQQAAVERMREMNSQAQIKNADNQKRPPASQPINCQENTANNKNINGEQIINNQNSSGNTQRNTPYRSPIDSSCSGGTQVNKSGLTLPFLESLFRDGDTTLIVGLLLLLMSEKSDKLLLFALVYILL